MGMTPLALAILHGRLNIAKELVKSGAGLDPASNNGESVLCFAVMNQHHDIVQWLLKTAFRTVNSVDPAGNTPLHLAVLNPDLEVIRALLSAGADPNKVSSKGHGTPLNYVVDTTTNISDAARLEVVQLLLKETALHLPRVSDGLYPIHEATAGGFTDVVTALLDHGVDTNIESAEPPGDLMRGTTPLHYAASQGNIATVSLLVRRGANVVAVNSMGEMPLHWAATNATPDSEAIIRLLAGGDTQTQLARVAARHAYGGTPLHAAAHRGLMENVQTLLDLGADPTVVAGNHHYERLLGISGTPEGMAWVAGHSKVAEYLAAAAETYSSSAGPRGVDWAMVGEGRWLASMVS